jgi:hypothetical protein
MPPGSTERDTVDCDVARATPRGGAAAAALCTLLGLGAALSARDARAQPQFQTEGRVGSYQVQDAASFNASVRSAHQTADGGWTTTPCGVVSRYVGDVTVETRSAIVEVNRPSAETHDRVIVMVTREGLLDDSVRGTKDRLELVRDPAGYWTIAVALRAWACQPGRGHAEYLSEPCR